jgi:hypothetical protein
MDMTSRDGSGWTSPRWVELAHSPRDLVHFVWTKIMGPAAIIRRAVTTSMSRIRAAIPTSSSQRTQAGTFLRSGSNRLRVGLRRSKSKSSTQELPKHDYANVIFWCGVGLLLAAIAAELILSLVLY